MIRSPVRSDSEEGRVILCTTHPSHRERVIRTITP
jgi:hypothetical protein